QFAGFDLTYRWKPLQQGLYRGFIGRLEEIANDRPGADHPLKGFYASGDYQLGQRWFTGLRIDSADRFGEQTPLTTDRGVAPPLTLWPSALSQNRCEPRHIHH